MLTYSTRIKLTTIAIISVIFLVGGTLVSLFMDFHLGQSMFGSVFFGLLVGIFEQFHVQSRHGRWLRSMHPIVSIIIYSGLLIIAVIIVMHANHAVFGRWDALPELYAHLPVILPLTLAISVLAIVVLRVIGFLGVRNIFNLMVGKYHRPVTEQKLFMFLDIKGSTALVERLGPIETRALIGKFFFDISAPIADHGGEIYRFTGDGVVATWPWQRGLAGGQIIQAIDEIRRTVADEREFYQSRFSHIPEFRIGVHGGEIVTSEEGDVKKAIGYYGDTIHIAARMEQKAKELSVETLFSKHMVDQMPAQASRFKSVGDVAVRGISKPIEVFELIE